MTADMIAFQANTGNLWIQPDDARSANLQLGMMAGTSPSVMGLPGGGTLIAFQANTGYLWTYATAGGSVNLQLGMMAGTSPSIAAYPDGRHVIAFQADTGNLWTRTTAGGSINLQLGMMAGTSPSIAVGDGGYVIAFQANTGYLWTRSEAHGSINLQLGMMAGTSPSIANADIKGAGIAVCQQLAEQVQSLQAKLIHVVDDTARQDLLTKLTAVQSEQERLGCVASLLRSISGSATTWAQLAEPIGFVGPRSGPVLIHLRIYEETGNAEWWFEPFLFVDGASRVELTQGYPATGQFDQESGSLSLYATLSIVNGNNPAQGDIRLSTDDTITFPHQFTLSGTPVAANDHLILVGEAQFSATNISRCLDTD